MSYLETLMKNVTPEEVEKFNKKYEKFDHKKTNSNDDTTSESKKPKRVFKNKNSLRRDNRKNSKKSSKKSKDVDFIKAINEAQSNFIDKTMPSESENEQILSCIQHMKNWSVFVNVNVENDINLTFNEKEYTFSKKRLLEGKYFQNMIKSSYNEKYGNVDLSFFPNRKKENMYTIKVYA